MQGGSEYGLDAPARERLLAAYEAEGFGYVDYADASGYGISIAHPSWLMTRIAESGAFRVVAFHEAGWDEHQDVIALQRL